MIYLRTLFSRRNTAKAKSISWSSLFLGVPLLAMAAVVATALFYSNPQKEITYDLESKTLTERIDSIEAKMVSIEQELENLSRLMKRQLPEGTKNICTAVKSCIK
jgi:hypothetical protein